MLTLRRFQETPRSLFDVVACVAAGRVPGTRGKGALGSPIFTGAACPAFLLGATVPRLSIVAQRLYLPV